MNILQVSTSDILGGAERVAWMLFQRYRTLGHHSWLAVGKKHSTDPGVLPMPDGDRGGAWSRSLLAARQHLLQPSRIDRPGAWRLSTLLGEAAHPGRSIGAALGREDFGFPATHQLLDLPPAPPDILHCHNLHGGYFHLRALPRLSPRLPVVVTLHDAWLLSGHCAHSFACERWQTGCGRCPDLTLYPQVRRDATAGNWARKRRIYARSRLFVSAPSQWLLDRVRQSMLLPATLESRVIPNGVDATIFNTRGRESARAALGLPADAMVVVAAAAGLRNNPWKDYASLRQVFALLAARFDRDPRSLLFITIGDAAPSEYVSNAELRAIPFITEPTAVALYLQAADVCLHAAKADTFPNVVIEALACGTPVIATAVGGIPEQILSLQCAGADPGARTYASSAATGVLVSPGSAEALAAATGALLRDHALCRAIGANAAADAAARFTLQRQVNSYLDWYRQLLLKDTTWPNRASASASSAWSSTETSENSAASGRSHRQSAATSEPTLSWA
jgi:glycosyltransferase involved in cell wall biosynthesis